MTVNAPPQDVYRLAASVRSSRFDVAGESVRYLVETEDRRFEVSRGVHAVIEALREEPATLEVLVRRLHARGVSLASGPRLDLLLRDRLLPHGIVLTAAPAASAGRERRRRRPSILWIQVPLLHARRVAPLIGFLQHLFHPLAVTAILLLAVLAHVIFYWQIAGQALISPGSLSLAGVLLLVLFLNLSAMFHELGHAAASRHYDCPVGNIGWGMYLIFSVLYTDVSPAWRLRRYQRVVVDLGGMYFELIAGVAALALLFVTGAQIFAVAFLLLDLSILTSLNPILRRDGYWLVTDIAGQPNLRASNLAALRELADRLLGRRPRPELEDRSMAVRFTIFLYSIASVVFFVAFLAWIGRRLATDLLPELPGRVAEISTSLGSMPPRWGLALTAAGHLLVDVVFVGVLLMALYHLVVGLGRALWPERRRPGAEQEGEV